MGVFRWEGEVPCTGTSARSASSDRTLIVLLYLGYGNLSPCSPTGKVITVIYLLVAIPLALVVLDNIGSILASIANSIWEKTVCCCCCFFSRDRKRKAAVSPANGPKDGPENGPQVEESTEVKLPITVGLLLTLCWVFAAAAIFALLEHWDYFDSVYFMFISITTIGFGDISPEKFHVSTAIGGIAGFRTWLSACSWSCSSSSSSSSDSLSSHSH